MSKLTNDIERLAEIGKELVRIGRLTHGLKWVELGDGIKVYSAENDSHTAFLIDNFQISYFNPIGIDARMEHLTRISGYIKRSEALLNSLIADEERRTTEELDLEKKKKIERMKEAIAELEAESRPNQSATKSASKTSDQEPQY